MTRSRESKQRRGRKRLRYSHMVVRSKKAEQKVHARQVQRRLLSARLGAEDGRFAVKMCSVFTREEMNVLADALQEAPGWEWRLDRNRGDKPFYITGDWTAQGHSRPGVDRVYPAGVAGKLEDKTGEGLSNFLSPYAIKASAALRKGLKGFKPEILQDLDEMQDHNRFGDFHLFMSAVGVAKMHKDPNDYVSLLFMIQSELGQGGDLELGGADTSLAWDVGDAIILDSSKVYHGTREYNGLGEDRLVGIFIVHKNFMRIHDVF